MKKIINHKLYDTDKARVIGSWDNGKVYEGLNFFTDTLYRKRTGEYFLHGEGGARTQYAVNHGDGRWTGGEAIIPLSYEKASEWAEEHLPADVYEAEFGDVTEDGSTVSMTINISSATKAKLERMAAKSGKSQVQIIEELINA